MADLRGQMQSEIRALQAAMDVNFKEVHRRLDDFRRDTIQRLEHINGDVGKAHDRAANLEGRFSEISAALERTRLRVHEIANQLMRYFEARGHAQAANEVRTVLSQPPPIPLPQSSTSPSGDDQVWTWRHTRWLLAIIGATVASTVGVLSFLGLLSERGLP